MAKKNNQIITPDKVLEQTTIKKEVKQLNLVALFAVFVSIFASIVGFFLSIYSIIDINRRNEKGITLSVIAMIISLAKLAVIVFILMNYEQVSVKIYDEYRKRTTTSDIQILNVDDKGETIPTTTTKQYTGKTTAYNEKKPGFDDACWEVIYTGYCTYEDVDDNGNTLCHYYEVNEKDKTGKDPLIKKDVRCPLYFLKKD